jgi:hypothetical protein
MQDALVAQYRAGRERELFVNEFLAKVFSPCLRFDPGIVLDSEGRKAGPFDIVIELPPSPSFPATISGAERLCMAENVAVILQISANLGDQWWEVGQAIRELGELKRFYAGIGQVPVNRIPVFAVGYKGPNQGALWRRMMQTDPQRCPDGALILQRRGIFVCGNPQKPRWKEVGAPAFYALVAEISAALMNSTPQVPDFQRYL